MLKKRLGIPRDEGGILCMCKLCSMQRNHHNLLRSFVDMPQAEVPSAQPKHAATTIPDQRQGTCVCCIDADIESWTFLSQFRVAALINDSVGTLAGGCYVDSDTKIGIILGTGTNACYVEQASNISALGKKNGHGQQRPLMAINTEWGNFDASSMPYTDVRFRTPALPIICTFNAIIFLLKISALASKSGHGQQQPLTALDTERAIRGLLHALHGCEPEAPTSFHKWKKTIRLANADGLTSVISPFASFVQGPTFPAYCIRHTSMRFVLQGMSVNDTPEPFMR